MTYTITDHCISCQRCLSSCPTEAIQTDGSSFWINVNRCNQCQGSHGVAQCWAVCPTDEGCVPLSTGSLAVTAHAEPTGHYWRAWFANYTHLMARVKASQPSGYWQQWFETYAQRLQGLQANSPGMPLMP